MVYTLLTGGLILRFAHLDKIFLEFTQLMVRRGMQDEDTQFHNIL